MNVCPGCFENRTLGRRIEEVRKAYPNVRKCDFHPRRKGVPIEEIGAIIDPALRANYSIGEWMFDHQEGDDLRTVIAETTGADLDDVVNGLIAWLIASDDYWPPDGEEAFYAEDQTYVPLRPQAWQQSALWRRFQDDILHRQRFFNAAAKGLLSEIFDGVQNQADVNGRPAFYRIDPDEDFKLYRARVIESDDQFQAVSQNPALEMGPPPSPRRRAGRMNAAGIPVLYAATDSETAVTELRPAVGSLVCIANFQLLRPLYVLDLTRFSRPGKQLDIFAKNQIRRSTQWAFLQSFAGEISKPILPSDEHLEYVSSQVVAEYLTGSPMRWRGDEVTLGAIIFGSAQRPGGKNIALFGDAAAVRASAEVAAKPSRSTSASLADPDFDFADFALATAPAPDPALDYVPNSLERIRITSAQFGSEPVANMSGHDL